MSARSLCIAWLWLSCAPASPPPAEEPAKRAEVRELPWNAPECRSALTSEGARVVWRAATEPLPRNRHFDFDVWVLRDEQPVTGLELIVRATMPEHGHGMNVEPRVLPRADGSYRVRGMLLHMGGRWELALHVVEPGRFHQATFELDV
jgi:hypothetical protein